MTRTASPLEEERGAVQHTLDMFGQIPVCHCQARRISGGPDFALSVGPVINGVTNVRLVYVCYFCGGKWIRVERADRLSAEERAAHIKTASLSNAEKGRIREYTDDMVDAAL